MIEFRFSQDDLKKVYIGVRRYGICAMRSWTESFETSLSCFDWSEVNGCMNSGDYVLIRGSEVVLGFRLDLRIW